MVWFYPVIFLLVHGPQGDQVRSYEGQSQEEVIAGISSEGKTAEVITQKQYDVTIQSENSSPKVTSPVKEQAKIDLNTKSKTDAERIDALITYLGI